MVNLKSEMQLTINYSNFGKYVYPKAQNGGGGNFDKFGETNVIHQ